MKKPNAKSSVNRNLDPRVRNPSFASRGAIFWIEAWERQIPAPPVPKSKGL